MKNIQCSDLVSFIISSGQKQVKSIEKVLLIKYEDPKLNYLIEENYFFLQNI
jgi:hypothetical protein